MSGRHCKYWTKEEVGYAIALAGTMPIEKIAKKIKRGKCGTKAKLNRLGISTSFYHVLPYEVYYNFFDTLTPQLFHFIGFWMADGNIYNNLVSFNLNTKDKKFLCDLVGQFSNMPVRNYKSKPNIATAGINSKKLAKILRDKYKFTSNKSLTCSLPTYISDYYFRYFIQGYWEGDGGINRLNKTIFIVGGSELVLSAIRDKLHTIIKVNLTLERMKTCFRLRASTNDSMTFLNWIYTDLKTIVMSRKYKLYKELYTYRQNRKKYKTIGFYCTLLGISSSILYNLKKKTSIEPDFINNNYKYYSTETFTTWLNKIGKGDLACQISKNI